MRLEDITVFEIVFTSIVGMLLILIIRLSKCLPAYKSHRKRYKSKKELSVMVIFGSGGHTTEMLKMIGKLDPVRYRPFHFVLAASDTTSKGKIEAVKLSYSESTVWHTIPRSREVKQSWFTTIGTTAWSFCHSFLLVSKLKPDIILCNGPGTCVPVCLSAFLLR